MLSFEEKKNLEKKMLFTNIQPFLKKKIWCGASPTTKKLPGSGNFFFRIGGIQSEQVGINGTHRKARLHCLILQHQNPIFFFKSGQIYMKDLESAEQKKKQISDFHFYELWKKILKNVYDIYFSNWVFLFIQPIPDLSYKFENLKR